MTGLVKAFSDLAGLTDPSGAVPRGRLLYLLCGLLSVFSGIYGGPPVLISPESGAGIKAGARTGLSAIVGGFFFCIAVFFAPLFR